MRLCQTLSFKDVIIERCSSHKALLSSVHRFNRFAGGCPSEFGGLDLLFDDSFPPELSPSDRLERGGEDRFGGRKKCSIDRRAGRDGGVALVGLVWIRASIAMAEGLEDRDAFRGGFCLCYMGLINFSILPNKMSVGVRYRFQFRFSAPFGQGLHISHCSSLHRLCRVDIGKICTGRRISE